MKAVLNSPTESPISLDPSNVSALEKHFIIGRQADGTPVFHNAYTAVRSAMQNLFDASKALDDAAAQVKAAGVNDPALTDRLRRAAVQRMNAARQAVANALDATRAGVNVANDDIDNHLRIPNHRTDLGSMMRANDVRAYIRSLPENQRADALRKALAEKDVDAIGAVLSASPLASGIDAKTAGYIRADAERVFAGPYVHLRTNIQRLSSLLETAIGTAERRHAGLTGAGDSPTARAARAVEAVETGGAQ